LSPRLNAVLAELHDPRWQVILAGCREIDLLADDRDEQVAMTLRGMPSLHPVETVAADLLAGIPGVVSVAVERAHRFRVFGAPHLEYAVGKSRYRVSPGSFFQASRFLLPELLAAVTDVQTGKLALDLFAGAGLFTLPLAHRFDQVVAVEANQHSAADLNANARAHSLANIRAVPTEAHDFLRRFAQPDAGLVVLDPPRAGVGLRTLKLLTSLRPKVIHYVSCSPPTLARDLGYLLAHGYELDSVELFDFFPQTYHLETLARLTRRVGKSASREVIS
jgi:23S rRNA (uracil1939-C5)-methyltransferase